MEKADIFGISKDIAHLQLVLDALDSAANLVTVGGGYAGCELAEECKKRGHGLKPDPSKSVIDTGTQDKI